MSEIVLDAEPRTVQGKGASRRLRRLENKIPAIIYGGDHEPVLLNLLQNKVAKALEGEAIYSSIISLQVGKKKQQVLLKDLQRHPFKDIIMHMDFQRISSQDEVVRMVPLHFTNEESAPGHIQGGVVNHSLTQVEIVCKAKDLPEFIEVDLKKLELDATLHLSDIKLPKNVSLNVDVSDVDYDLPVVSIHVSKSALAEEAKEADEEADEAQKDADSEEVASQESAADDAEDKSAE